MLFKKYKSNPQEIEAAQFTDETKDKIFNSLTGQFAADFESCNPILKIKTIHGDIAIIRLGDWIVKDDEIGTYYPIKDSVFKQKYYISNGE